jgi:antitoxin component YwqK of YwqJK toxin-antitoxin module
MKKHVLLLFVACSLFLQVAAQRQNNYYLKNNGREVNSIDSADYIRVVQEPERGSLLYPIKEYYPNESKKSIGYSSRINPPKYEGQFRSFYKSGKTKQVLRYVGGKLIDTAYTYYPNGGLYSAIVYTPTKETTDVFIKTIKDSTGKELVTNGTGNAVFYDDDFTYVRETGTLKNGMSDGDWSGVIISNDTLTYKESYAGGKMLSGESKDNKGNSYHYTVSEVLPSYKGGMTAFYKYISRAVKYPSHLVAPRIQGIVSVSFVIMPDGEIDYVHATNQVHPDLAAEAVRVIKASKGWEPGIQKGRKVKVSYNIPVSFALSN